MESFEWGEEREVRIVTCTLFVFGLYGRKIDQILETGGSKHEKQLLSIYLRTAELDGTLWVI